MEFQKVMCDRFAGVIQDAVACESAQGVQSGVEGITVRSVLTGNMI
jgi:hypothetical protein